MSKPWIWYENARPGKGPNNSVRIVQKALIKEFKTSHTPSAVWGKKTTGLYARWQRSLGYSGADADGVPGETSMAKLAAKHGFDVKHKPSKRVASPVPGKSVTFPYGVKRSNYAAGYHTGDDYAASTGAKVVAVRNGTIQWSNGAGGAYGNWIGLKADNGRVYVYCHLSSRSVSTGAKVKAGQQIGKVGATGNVTGPHLHFEDHPAGAFKYARGRKPKW